MLIAIERAGPTDVWSSIVPLNIFAVDWPLVGLLAFRWLDVVVRRRREVDLY